MSEQTAYPLSWPTGWPRTQHAQRSRFGTHWQKPTVAKARDHLIREIRLLGGRNIVLSSNLKLRNDGLPYSNLKEPDDLGVAVYFRLKDHPQVIACDKWNTVGDNLWAITKSIEALRGIDRWGSTQFLERAFTGFIALEEKTGANCWEVLGINQDATEQQIMDAYRRKAREAHPDTGGSAEAFQAVVQAKDIAIQTRIRRVA